MINYFSMSELFHTDTGEYNIIRGDHIYPNLERLRIVLNVLRGLIGEPIKVNSGYRNDVVNRAVGGAENSLHMKGRAADITCTHLHELLELCMRLKESRIFEEVIYYPDRNFIHVAI